MKELFSNKFSLTIWSVVKGKKKLLKKFWKVFSASHQKNSLPKDKRNLWMIVEFKRRFRECVRVTEKNGGFPIWKASVYHELFELLVSPRRSARSKKREAVCFNTNYGNICRINTWIQLHIHGLSVKNFSKQNWLIKTPIRRFLLTDSRKFIVEGKLALICDQFFSSWRDKKKCEYSSWIVWKKLTVASNLCKKYGFEIRNMI